MEEKENDNYLIENLSVQYNTLYQNTIQEKDIIIEKLQKENRKLIEEAKRATQIQNTSSELQINERRLRPINSKDFTWSPMSIKLR